MQIVGIETEISRNRDEKSKSNLEKKVKTRKHNQKLKPWYQIYYALFGDISSGNTCILYTYVLFYSRIVTYSRTWLIKYDFVHVPGRGRTHNIVLLYWQVRQNDTFRHKTGRLQL